jgi:hypothetical protein
VLLQVSTQAAPQAKIKEEYPQPYLNQNTTHDLHPPASSTTAMTPHRTVGWLALCTLNLTKENRNVTQ